MRLGLVRNPRDFSREPVACTSHKSHGSHSSHPIRISPCFPNKPWEFPWKDWLPDMDLNHDKQIQSLLCYRYTIGQSVRRQRSDIRG